MSKYDGLPDEDEFSAAYGIGQVHYCLQGLKAYEIIKQYQYESNLQRTNPLLVQSHAQSHAQSHRREQEKNS
jgi:hypothetical protein